MLKFFMAGAGVLALASTAALADPAAQTSETARYLSKPESAAQAMTPIDVTTKEDAKRLAEAEFKLADANADGAIDAAEFTSYAAMVAKKEGAAPINASPTDAAFAAIAKGDKAISGPELAEARSKSFDDADANKDKILDPLEQQKFATMVAVKPADAAKTE